MQSRKWNTEKENEGEEEEEATEIVVSNLGDYIGDERRTDEQFHGWKQ